MIKRVPSRNNRSKGIKGKHVLQICLLLGVCFWLIYQVKHSHDKKKEYNEKDGKVSVRGQGIDEVLKLGRKDLHPRFQGKSMGVKDEQDEEEEAEVEEEETKHGEREENKQKTEEEQDGGTKHEEEDDDEEEREEGYKPKEGEREAGTKAKEEDIEEESRTEDIEEEGRGGGDDEIDESDHDIIEGEDDHEAFLDEEKEREEDVDEKENEGEDKESRIDNETPAEDEDHVDQKSHEAREKHYNADDASSAVTHGGQTINTDPDKASSTNSNENPGLNDVEQQEVSNNEDMVAHDNHNSDVAQGEHQKPDDTSTALTNDTRTASSESEKSSSTYSKENPGLNDLEQKNNSHDAVGENGNSLNTTVVEQKDDKVMLSDSEGKSAEEARLLNTPTATMDAADNSTTGAGVIFTSLQHDTVNVQPQNGTAEDATTSKEFNLQSVVSEQVNNGTTADGGQSDNSSTSSSKNDANTATGGSSSSSGNSESKVSDEIIKPNIAAEAEVNSDSTKETTEANNQENLHTDRDSGATDENLGSSTINETGDAIDSSTINETGDATNHSSGQDETEARLALDTLPETGTEGLNNRNAAVE